MVNPQTAAAIDRWKLQEEPEKELDWMGQTIINGQDYFDTDLGYVSIPEIEKYMERSFEKYSF